MPDVYNTVAGFVQFDPDSRTVELSDGDKQVTDVVIQAIGSGGRQVKVTLWETLDLSKGDFVVAQGKFQTREYQGKEYISLSANHFMVFPHFLKTKSLFESGTIEGEDNPF